MANEIQRRNLFDNLMNMRDWMNDDFFSDLTPAADHGEDGRGGGDHHGIHRESIRYRF